MAAHTPPPGPTLPTDEERDAERDAKLDTAVRMLEQRLASQPRDQQAARRLVMLLDFHVPGNPELGAYTRCQNRLAALHSDAGWTRALLDTEAAARSYKTWEALLDSHDVRPHVNFNQLFMGQHPRINGKVAACDAYLAFFKTEGVIPGICHDCYKVQLLPQNLAAHIATYFLLRDVALPRDNARKCMIEVRDYSPYPYKAYVFCESEDEAQSCLSALAHALAVAGIGDVRLGITHGCTEYGVRYPDFKYSKDGAHRRFARPPGWDEAEARLHAGGPPAPPPVPDCNNAGITIRDVLGIRTWVRYAELIGDATYARFARLLVGRPELDMPEPFIARVRAQASARQGQMAELAESLAARA